MFDWNHNGKHDLSDDLFTIGLVQHMIDESKNKGRTVYSHHVNDEDKTDTRSEAVKCLWILFGIAILIGGVAFIVCCIENQLLGLLVLIITIIVGFIVMSQGNDD